MAFFALFELGSLITAAANSSNMFIGGRAIAGMGTSGILNGAFTIIAGCVPMVKRPGASFKKKNITFIHQLTVVIALIGMVTASKSKDSNPLQCKLTYDIAAQFGLVIGPFLGGLLTQYTTWRWCKSFYVQVFSAF
jgi:MFS family permease